MANMLSRLFTAASVAFPILMGNMTAQAEVVSPDEAVQRQFWKMDATPEPDAEGIQREFWKMSNGDPTKDTTPQPSPGEEAIHRQFWKMDPPSPK